MKDIREVLKQKEEELRQLRAQTICLRLAVPLLLDPGDPPLPPAPDEQILDDGKSKRWP